MPQTKKLATLRGRRRRMSTATKGSRMNAMVTAVIAVTKNTRPKYRIAIMTPMATIGRDMCRASCTAVCAMLGGLIRDATARFHPCLECSMAESIMKLI